MTVRYVLDTDTVTHLQRGNENVARRIRSLDRAQVATTVVTAYEQLRGRFNQINKAAQRSRSRKARGELPRAYRLLREAIEAFQNVCVLDYTQDAEDCHNTLRAAGVTPQRVKPQDLQIASITLSIGATLVTGNRSDFQHVPNLRTEDWSI